MTTDTELKQQQAAFERSLAAFEQCVDTPFIPGELQQWIAAAAEAFGRLEPVFARQAELIHAPEFGEIAREDPELLQRVAEMREEDRAIFEEMARIKEIVGMLLTRVAIAGRDEASVKEELDAFVRDSLQFVARVRKQEVTVRTWWVESFHRDRGTVD